MIFYGSTSAYSEANPEGYEAGEYYLKRNGIDCNWQLQYSSWKHDDITLTGDDAFEIKFNNQVNVVGDSFTITPVYADELAKRAVLWYSTSPRRAALPIPRPRPLMSKPTI